jgi:hypothetical protein
MVMSRLHRCWLAACLTCTLIATIDAQGACHPQFYDDITTACVADCTVLIPSRLNYASDNDECVDACPLGTYESGGMCVNACVGERSYVNLTVNGAGTCVADCRLLNPPRINFQNGAYQCVDNCSDSRYDIDEGTCVGSCPGQRSYTNRSNEGGSYGTCVTDCRGITTAPAWRIAVC